MRHTDADMHIEITLGAETYDTDPVGITPPVVADEGIVGLSINASVLDHEPECIVHESTTATLVLELVTVNQLLL